MFWTVLVVDDNASIRKCVCSLFSEEPDFKVIGEAEHGLDAIAKAKFFRPDLIILDFQMPLMNGMEAAPHLLKHLPTVFIIMLTLFGSHEMEALARSVGIHAFVSKSKAVAQLIPAAHALLDRIKPFPDDTVAAA
jgi:DNA-binding NarL/FixJ family response regulator